MSDRGEGRRQAARSAMREMDAYFTAILAEHRQRPQRRRRRRDDSDDCGDTAAAVLRIPAGDRWMAVSMPERRSRVFLLSPASSSSNRSWAMFVS